MKKKKTPLYVPVLWFITTGAWTVTLLLSLSHGAAPDRMLLNWLAVLASLAAAIANLVRYNKTKDLNEDS